MLKIISILMSLLILASSTNMNFASHYCGGKLKDFSLLFGTDQAGCGMEDETDSEACGAENFNPNCCQDKIQSFNIEDDYSVSTNLELKTKVIVLLAVLYLFSASVTEFTHDFLSHSPPEDLTSVFLPLFRVFLI